MTDVSGSCACGAVKYSARVSGALFCHCRVCRRFSGAPATAWTDTPKASFKLRSGEVAYYQSSAHTRRGFCARCHTPLIYDSQMHGIEDFGLTLYSLDDPSVVAPTLHIWTRQRVIPITDNLPQHESETPEYAAAIGGETAAPPPSAAMTPRRKFAVPLAFDCAGGGVCE